MECFSLRNLDAIDVQKGDTISFSSMISFLFQERPRPDFAARAPELRENPVTGIKEPYFDPKDRLPRILSGMAAIIIMVCCGFV